MLLCLYLHAGRILVGRDLPSALVKCQPMAAPGGGSANAAELHAPDCLPVPSPERAMPPALCPPLQVSELRERAQELPDELLVCLVGDMITEEALPT